VNRYVVVAVGRTTWEPLSGTAAPLREPEVAFWDDHVRVVGSPEATVVGLAEIPAATGPEAETVTVVVLVVV
jgi:hypothetical protein